MHRLAVFFCLASVLIISSGCLPGLSAAPTPTPSVTPTATVEPSATPTFVWFPPTPTYTPRPTPEFTSTPELLANLGDVLLDEQFEAGDAWTTGTTSTGAISVVDNGLTIAITEQKAYLYSIRWQPVVKDFYLEITTNPNLCEGKDEYGILVRVTAELAYYRFGLSCDGQVQMERISNNSLSIRMPWYTSGAFPPGAPSVSRLGVWMKGTEMSFFINNVHQFTLKDPVLYSGSIGLYARSTGGHSLTVNFSNLVIRSLIP
jgi:hypothetical protein